MRGPTRHAPLATGVALLALAALAAVVAPALAVVCNVATSNYPTIESAVRDASCQPINVPAGIYRENLTVDRSVSIFGAGTTSTSIEGRVWVQGATTDILFDGFNVAGGAPHVSGCWSTIVDARGGATLDSIALTAGNQNAASGDCRIFEDGFEFGSPNAWSSINN